MQTDQLIQSLYFGQHIFFLSILKLNLEDGCVTSSIVFIVLSFKNDLFALALVIGRDKFNKSFVKFQRIRWEEVVIYLFIIYTYIRVSQIEMCKHYNFCNYCCGGVLPITKY